LLLGKLQSELLQPEVVDYAVMEFHRQLVAAVGSLPDELGGMRQRKTRLEAEVRRLVSAVAESGHSKSLLEEIGRKEAELERITDGLFLATPKSIESRVGDIRRFVASGLKDLRDLLRKDTALARTEVLKHSSEIRMTPHLAPGSRFYVADGKWDLLGKDWTEAASRQTGGFGWLRGTAMHSRFRRYHSGLKCNELSAFERYPGCETSRFDAWDGNSTQFAGNPTTGAQLAETSPNRTAGPE
jgi:hypothetical protein